MASIPHLPLVPDPLRRIRVPKDLAAVTTVDPAEDPAAGGLSERTVDRIWASIRGLYRTGVHPAIQLCLRRHGQIVLNRSIGHARGNGPDDPPDAEKVLVTPDTPYCVYSTSKAITAMVIHLLDERGALDINDLVTKYLPDYGRHGKEQTTIAHVLAHRAGVPTLPSKVLDLDHVDDIEFAVEAISDSKPFAKPGTLLAYHAISGGFILGAIVQRVTGKTIREVLAESILDPLDFRWNNYGVAPDDVGKVGVDYVTGPRLLPPLSNVVRRVLGAPVEGVVETANDPRFQTAIVPAGNVITTGNELSRFFEIFRAGGILDNVRIMQPETIRRALTEQSRLEFDLSLGFPTRFSSGLMLGAKVLSLYGLDTDLAFGHLGFINIMGWADPERGISGGLTNSGKAIIYPELPRFYALMQRIASTVPKVPADERMI
jgi:CubicO group peptidase (beta-lactamase class C family)